MQQLTSGKRAVLVFPTVMYLIHQANIRLMKFQSLGRQRSSSAACHVLVQLFQFGQCLRSTAHYHAQICAGCTYELPNPLETSRMPSCLIMCFIRLIRCSTFETCSSIALRCYPHLCVHTADTCREPDMQSRYFHKQYLRTHSEPNRPV